MPKTDLKKAHFLHRAWNSISLRTWHSGNNRFLSFGCAVMQPPFRDSATLSLQCLWRFLSRKKGAFRGGSLVVGGHRRRRMNSTFSWFCGLKKKLLSSHAIHFYKLLRKEWLSVAVAAAACGSLFGRFWRGKGRREEWAKKALETTNKSCVVDFKAGGAAGCCTTAQTVRVCHFVPLNYDSICRWERKEEKKDKGDHHHSIFWNLTLLLAILPILSLRSRSNCFPINPNVRSFACKDHGGFLCAFNFALFQVSHYNKKSPKFPNETLNIRHEEPRSLLSSSSSPSCLFRDCGEISASSTTHIFPHLFLHPCLHMWHLSLSSSPRDAAVTRLQTLLHSMFDIATTRDEWNGDDDDSKKIKESNEYLLHYSTNLTSRFFSSTRKCFYFSESFHGSGFRLQWKNEPLLVNDFGLGKKEKCRFGWRPIQKRFRIQFNSKLFVGWQVLLFVCF